MKSVALSQWLRTTRSRGIDPENTSGSTENQSLAVGGPKRIADPTAKGQPHHARMLQVVDPNVPTQCEGQP
ncbi:MAG TPA: hypothetical protein VFD98_07750, partial [Terracidiphilus sp.]|nr:hypothetical protein [Terracidiphilus sp.]